MTNTIEEDLSAQNHSTRSKEVVLLFAPQKNPMSVRRKITNTPMGSGSEMKPILSSGMFIDNHARGQ